MHLRGTGCSSHEGMGIVLVVIGTKISMPGAVLGCEAGGGEEGLKGICGAGYAGCWDG